MPTVLVVDEATSVRETLRIVLGHEHDVRAVPTLAELGPESRPDVAVQYPFLFNSQNSGWRFVIDTTKLSNARHQVTVRVVDFTGLVTEIGSVNFFTQNANPVP